MFKRFQCHKCGAVIPLGRSMVVSRIISETIGLDNRSAADLDFYCGACVNAVACSEECAECERPILAGEDVIALSFDRGTYIPDDDKFQTESRTEVYRSHWQCNATAAAIAASSLPG